MADTKQVIRDRIVEEYLQGRPTEALQDDTDLIQEEIIDSLGIFLLLEFIQERFGVAIDPEDVTLENFQTLEAITELVTSKQGMAAS
ncbi:MAG: acyl carrier protein [Acidimicrobiia bacterium]